MLELSEDQKLLVDSLEAFTRKGLAPHIGEYVERHEFPTELVKAFLEPGFMGTSYDTNYDGAGMGASGAALVCEILARTEPGFAAIFLCNSAPMTTIDWFGSHELKERWLRPLCRGEIIASFGVSETHGGSDVANIKTKAERDGDEYVLNGAKVFSTNAGTPLHGLSTIVAITNPDLGPKGLSTFVVPVGTPGFAIGKPSHKIGWRIAPSVELFFDNCRIPAENLIGNEGDGLKQILSTLSIGRILVAATALGLARKAIDLSKQFGANRKVFGKCILEHQGLAFPLAEILTDIFAAELMIRQCSKLVDESRPFRNETSMVKLFATELALRAANKAIQVHGGYGIFQEYEVSGLLGEAKTLHLVEGTSEIQKLVIARELLDSV